MVDPVKTTAMGKPIGKDSSISSWQGDQWKTGGGSTWGWYSYDPALNLIYYGTGNPSTWNPVQRPGDNKWSMTIFARDADTGMAKWVYQMTPHDEWDYDGINEMILADMDVKGKPTKALVHFDRNGFGYTLNRETGELLTAEKYDPAVNWASKIDMATGRPVLDAKFGPGAQGEDKNTRNICPAALGSKDQQPAAFSPKTSVFYVPTNHVCMDYEPFKVSYTAGQPFVGATLSMYPPKGDTNLGNFIAWDASAGKILWSDPEPFSVWSGALATAGDVVFYGTLDGYLKAVDAKTGKELYRYKTPSGIIGNVNTYSAQRQAVHRRAVGRGRLGRHRHGGGPRQRHRRPRRGRRLQAARELHAAWRRAVRVRPGIRLNGTAASAPVERAGPGPWLFDEREDVDAIRFHVGNGRVGVRVLTAGALVQPTQAQNDPTYVVQDSHTAGPACLQRLPPLRRILHALPRPGRRRQLLRPYR